MLHNIDFDFWKFLSGLGIFLFGMYHLETGLKGLAGKSLKRLLHFFTNKKWKALLTGFFSSAILQSGSLVMLLITAFLSGGLISLQNSLTAVFGANLGITMAAWIIASLGFEISISQLSLPLLAIGTLSYILMDTRPVLKNTGSFLIGFGLLFLGIDFMKLSVEKIADNVNLFSNIQIIYLLSAGLILTAMIQSSLALIVIVLSLLNAGLLDVYQSAIIVVGANIGNTSTLIIASFKGNADKKRLALANFIFKLIAASITLILLNYIIDILITQLNINDPVLLIVSIHTIINLIGIIIFYPLTIPFVQFLKNYFIKSEPKGECIYIKNVTPKVPYVAINALDKELENVFNLTREFILDSLRNNINNNNVNKIWYNIFKTEVNPLKKYLHLKKIEDEITYFYTKIQEQNLSEPEANLLADYMFKLRSMIYSAKNIKDVLSNIQDIKDSDDELAKNILSQLYQFAVSKEQEISGFYITKYNPPNLNNIHNELEYFYNKTIDYLYKNIKTENSRYIPVSTITNVIKKTIASIEELTLSVTTSY